MLASKARFSIHVSLSQFNIQSITRKLLFFPVFCTHPNFKLLFLCRSKIDFESIKLRCKQQTFSAQPTECRLSFVSFVGWVNLFIPFYIIYRKLILRLTIFTRLTGKCLLMSLCSFLFSFWLDREMHGKPNYSTAVTNIYWIFFLVEIVCKYESESENK